jgi:hypothetical protein
VQEAIAIVQRGFPILAEYPEERIVFLVKTCDPRNLASTWVIVMEEAWKMLEANPPVEMRVEIRDAPGDAEARGYPIEYANRVADRRQVWSRS